METSILQWHHSLGFFWLRLFGRGLAVKDTRRHPLLFSERNGCWRMVYLGNYLIKIL